MERKLFLSLLLLGLLIAVPYAHNSQQKQERICAQVITYAKNPATGEIRAFPNPCSVPEGWDITPAPIDQENPTEIQTDSPKGIAYKPISIFVYANGKPINAMGILLKDEVVLDYDIGHRINLRGEGNYTLMLLALGYPITKIEVSPGEYVVDIFNNTSMPVDIGKCIKMGKPIDIEQAKNRIRSKFGDMKEFIGDLLLEFKECKALYKAKIKKQMRLMGLIPLPFEEEVEVEVDAETGEVK